MSSNQPGTNTSEGTPSGAPTMQRQKSNRGAMIGALVVVVVIVVVLAVGYSAGWFNAAKTSGNTTCTLPSEVTLKGEGSTLVAPLMDQWATSYWNGAAVTYDSAGSSAGIGAITAKTVDYGASDAPLDPAQVAAMPSPVLTIPESAGGVVPIYNLAGVTTLNFNGSVLAQIFDGTLTNWNNTPLQSLNTGVTLPNATIIPIHRTGGSGTSFIFTSFLTLENTVWASTYGKGTAWPTNITVGVGASGNGGVASTVGTTPYSIGYVDLNYALNAGSGVGIGNVKNPSGNFIHATVANTESALVDSNPTLPAGTGDWYNVSLLNAPGANDYPITSLTYVLVFQNLTAYSNYNLGYAENLVDFLHYIVTVGQNVSAELYYVPLTADIVSSDLASINSMTFGGQAIPVCVPTS
jgi:phosphate transport system substrate-binding protein